MYMFRKLIPILLLLIVACGLVYLLTHKKNTMDTKTMTGDNHQAISDVESAKVAQVGSVVLVNYTGMFEDGKVFDSNILPENGHVDPIAVTLGAHQVIKGWEDGLIGMKIGEKKHLVIKPEDAYGVVGRPPIIPPNATLVFDVEVLSIN